MTIIIIIVCGALLLTWLYWFFVELKKRKEVAFYANSDEKAIRRRITHNYLFGLSTSNYFLITTNIALAFAAIASLYLNLLSMNNIDRAYLGLASTSTPNPIILQIENTSSTIHYPTSTGVRITLPIKNYGNLPTEYQAQLIGAQGTVVPFPEDDGVIMPNQEIDLIWDQIFPMNTTSVCSLYDSKIKIDYEGHSILVQPKTVSDPFLGDQDLRDYDLVEAFNCSSTPIFYFWHSQNLN